MKSCAQWCVYFATEGKWQLRLIYLHSSQSYDGNRPFKFLIRLAVESWDFYRLIVWQGDQMTVGSCLVFCRALSRADVSMCAAFKNLTSCSWKKRTACQSQFILYLYIQYGTSPSSACLNLSYSGEFSQKIIIKEVFVAFPAIQSCFTLFVMAKYSDHWVKPARLTF